MKLSDDHRLTTAAEHGSVCLLPAMQHAGPRTCLQGRELLSAEALGHPVTAFLTLEIRQGAGHEAVARHLAGIPEVLEAHTITGAGDMWARVVARSNADLQRVIDRALDDPAIVRSSTVIALATQIPYRVLMDSDGRALGPYSGGDLPVALWIDRQGVMRRRFMGLRSAQVLSEMLDSLDAPPGKLAMTEPRKAG